MDENFENDDGATSPNSQEDAMANLDGSGPPLAYTDEDFAYFFDEPVAPSTVFTVQPSTECNHLKELLKPFPAEGLDIDAPCVECSSTGENWICLTCFKVLCSRYVNQHMLDHSKSIGHVVALGLADNSVWCFDCDCYITSEVLYPYRNAVHRSKFGIDIPQ